MVLLAPNYQEDISWLLKAEAHGVECSWLWGLNLNFAYAETTLDIFAYGSLTQANKFTGYF